MHECFFRGNIDCLEELIKYKPDASLKHYKSQMVPLECVFRDDMYEALDFIINNQEARKLVNDDPNLSIT